MNTILVTGGSGFIGSHVIQRLLSNYDIVNFDLKKSQNNQIKQIIGDITDYSLVEKAVEKCDAIIHLAAQISVPRSFDDPSENDRINVHGTQNIIEAAQKYGIKRLIMASSAAVYGRCNNLPLNEQSAGECLSPYAKSKWQNESQILLARESGLQAVALRFFNVYGPGQRTDGAYAAVIPKFIQMMSKNEQPIVNGDGMQSRDFIHVSDVANAIEMLLKTDWQMIEQHAYNIASQSQSTLMDLIEVINKEFRAQKPSFEEILPLYQSERQGDIRHSHADISLIKKALGWTPKTIFSQGIKELVDLELNNKGGLE